MRATIFMGIGAPGSGKTTILLKKYVEQQQGQTIYVCPDEIREELNGKTEDQSNGQIIFQLVYARIQEALLSRSNVVYDATNALIGWRKKTISDFRKLAPTEVLIIGVFVNTPENIVKERNAGRERKVPDDVVQTMLDGLKNNKPSITDGFDEPHVLNENGELQESHSK